MLIIFDIWERWVRCSAFFSTPLADEHLGSPVVLQSNAFPICGTQKAVHRLLQRWNSAITKWPSQTTDLVRVYHGNIGAVQKCCGAIGCGFCGAIMSERERAEGMDLFAHLEAWWESRRRLEAEVVTLIAIGALGAEISRTLHPAGSRQGFGSSGPKLHGVQERARENLWWRKQLKLIKQEKPRCISSANEISYLWKKWRIQSYLKVFKLSNLKWNFLEEWKKAAFWHISCCPLPQAIRKRRFYPESLILVLSGATDSVEIGWAGQKLNWAQFRLSNLHF